MMKVQYDCHALVVEVSSLVINLPKHLCIRSIESLSAVSLYPNLGAAAGPRAGSLASWRTGRPHRSAKKLYPVHAADKN